MNNLLLNGCQHGSNQPQTENSKRVTIVAPATIKLETELRTLLFSKTVDLNFYYDHLPEQQLIEQVCQDLRDSPYNNVSESEPNIHTDRVRSKNLYRRDIKEIKFTIESWKKIMEKKREFDKFLRPFGLHCRLSNCSRWKTGTQFKLKSKCVVQNVFNCTTQNEAP
jgi:hypothetical protein